MNVSKLLKTTGETSIVMNKNISLTYTVTVQSFHQSVIIIGSVPILIIKSKSYYKTTIITMMVLSISKMLKLKMVMILISICNTSKISSTFVMTLSSTESLLLVNSENVSSKSKTNSELQNVQAIHSLTTVNQDLVHHLVTVLNVGTVLIS
jgi:hypothetical protein